MKIIWVFILLLLLPSASAIWVSEEPVELDFYLMDFTPQTIEPGETTILNITLKNLAPADGMYLNTSLDPDDVSPVDVVGIIKKRIDRITGSQEPDKYFGVIQNEEIQLSIVVHVDNNTTEGVYNVPLVLFWEDNLRRHWSQTLDMGIHIKGNPLIRVVKVSTSPVELRTDTEKNEVNIAVENAGKTTAKSVKLDVELKDPFTEAYSSSSSDFVTHILPDSSNDFVVTIDIDEDALAGTYTLPLKLSYRTDDAAYKVEDKINIKISKKAKFEVQNFTSAPSVIIPGDDFIINIPVENTGQERAENVKAVIKTKSYFTGVKTDYLGDIKVGDSKLATFELTADRDTIPDNYENDITLIWSEGEDRLEEITSFGITVSRERDEGTFPAGAAVILGLMIGIVAVVVWRKLR